jgi:TetR/AcrR family tetracycline transcriptional repressor
MSHSKLDRETIVAEALALLGEEGLANVSQRKLAARLEVTVSSLYWHIRDREQLLALLCEGVFRDCLAQTAEATDWAGWLRNFGLALWDKQVSLRDCQKLIIVATLDQMVREALQDEVAAHLAAHGIARAQGMLMQMSVQALVTGWSTLDRDHLLSRRDFETALDALLDGWRARVTPA